MRRKLIAGQTLGKFTLIRAVDRWSGATRYWLATCTVCGQTKEVAATAFYRGCGCGCGKAKALEASRKFKAGDEVGPWRVAEYAKGMRLECRTCGYRPTNGFAPVNVPKKCRGCREELVRSEPGKGLHETRLAYVRRLRSRGFNNSEIAKRLGVSRQRVQQIFGVSRQRVQQIFGDSMRERIAEAAEHVTREERSLREPKGFMAELADGWEPWDPKPKRERKVP